MQFAHCLVSERLSRVNMYIFTFFSQNSNFWSVDIYYCLYPMIFHTYVSETECFRSKWRMNIQSRMHILHVYGMSASSANENAISMNDYLLLVGNHDDEHGHNFTYASYQLSSQTMGWDFYSIRLYILFSFLKRSKLFYRNAKTVITFVRLEIPWTHKISRPYWTFRTGSLSIGQAILQQ